MFSHGLAPNTRLMRSAESAEPGLSARVLCYIEQCSVALRYAFALVHLHGAGADASAEVVELNVWMIREK
jgi:hypothetical protein